jgi:hypothetical protein
MSVMHTSEKYTRAVILSAARSINIPDLRVAVERGSKISADFKDKETYFKFGSGIFMLIGFVFTLLSIGCVVLTLVLHGLLGPWFFFYYAPGLILYSIGIALSMKERNSAKNITTCFDRKSLMLSCLSGALCSLFVTSFS